MGHPRLLAVVVVLFLSQCAGGVSAQQDSTIDDKDVHVVHFEDLSYPRIALVSHTEGIVVVRVTLDAAGGVVSATALSGPNLLIAASTGNAKKWKFAPNSQSAAVIVYNFRISGLCGDAHSADHMTLNPPNFATIIDCNLPAMY
jgi:hypothetical protein